MYKIKESLKKYNNFSIGIKATIWFLICNLLEKGITIITMPIFTRLLPIKEYGKFNIFNSWVSLLTIFISLNLYSGVCSQGLVKNEEKRNEFASSLQGLSFTLSVFWLIIFILFKKRLSEFLGLSNFQLFSIVLLVWTNSSFNFWATRKRVEFEYKKLIRLTLIIIILKPILGILFVLNFEDKVNGRILSILLVNLCFYPLLFYKQIKEGKKFYHKEYWLYALKFNIPLIPHYLSNSILSVSDRIMIGKLIGESAAGIYGLAYSLSMITTL